MNPILASYIPIAETIAGMFGKNCEVVIHDLSRPENSVVFVANGGVTGRQLGQSFDHLVKQVLLNKNFKNDHSINYWFDTPDGRRIKSASSMIRDTGGEILGMLCINCDVTVLRQVQEQMSAYLDDEQETIDAEPPQDVMTVIDQLILNIIGTQDVKNLTRKKCVEVVKFMDDKGIFLVKGAIDKVADIMGVSKVTVYSYLDEAKGKR